MEVYGSRGPVVEVVSVGNATHPCQILTGLLLLAEQNEITLRWPDSRRMRSSPRIASALNQCPAPHVALMIEGRLAYFDLHDSGQLVIPLVRESARYFKRSYLATTAQHYSNVERLGLYYEVTSPRTTRVEWQRILRCSTLRARISALVYVAMTTLNVGQRRWFRPTPDSVHAPPSSATDGRAIFMCRLWDPKEDARLSRADAEDRHQLNESRVTILRALRKQLGPRFVGGLQHTPYAVRHYPDLLLPRASDGLKSQYFSALRRAAVGVATTGLHGSIGGKFAEYVAFSKGIVSEPLRYGLPGEFGAERNFVPFQTVDECVARTCELLEDQSRLWRIQVANYEYFHRVMRADALMRRCIVRVLAPNGREIGARTTEFATRTLQTA